VLVCDDVIAAVGTDGVSEVNRNVEVLDCTGKTLVPGLVDMHVHLREPGFEYRETIESGTRAAAHGGFTAVVAMPNTEPTADEGAMIKFVREKAADTGVVRVYPLGALTRGLHGEQLAEMHDMLKAGAIAFSDDGRGIQNPQLMRRAFEYACVFDAPVITHCEDEQLVDGGVVNEGLVSTRLGLAGQPTLAEALMVARDIELARLTGARLHIAHVSCAESVELIRVAKAAGDVRISAEVTPHHLFLSEDALDERYDTNLKMNPPLRSEKDRQTVLEAFIDGTIDALATDHAPHAPQEKELEFELANFGTTGLETALSLVLTHLIAPGLLDWTTLVERMSAMPRRILKLEPVQVKPGCVADLTIIDPKATVTVTKDWLAGKSKNSAFLGAELRGTASDVMVGGKLVLRDGVVA
jgi:dihydroorotase